LAMIIGMIVLAYILAVAFDRYCYAVQGNDLALTPEEFDERRNASNLTKGAGLAGILQEERARVIRLFFGQRTFKYSSIAKRNGAIGDSAEVCKNVEQLTRIKLESTGTTGPICNCSIEDLESQNTVPAVLQEDVQNQELEELCDTDHDGTCPICLNEYGMFIRWEWV
jgi:hypothetical protein